MFKTSESIKEITGALVKFQAMVPPIRKDAKNPAFKRADGKVSKYASLSGIRETIAPALKECGLVVSQYPSGVHGLTTMVSHADSGEWILGYYDMKPANDTPQGNGSRLTYQERYALTAALGLVIEEDDDGNEASKTSKKLATPEEVADAIAKIDATRSLDELKDVYSKLTPRQRSNAEVAAKKDMMKEGFALITANIEADETTVNAEE